MERVAQHLCGDFAERRWSLEGEDEGLSEVAAREIRKVQPQRLPRAHALRKLQVGAADARAGRGRHLLL